MAKTLSRDEFLRNLIDSSLFSPEEIHHTLNALPGAPAADGEAVAERLIAAGKLTPFQAAAVRERHFEELTIGNYQILDHLGAGGMGTVYKARHRRMNRVVAIKVLSRSVGQPERFVQRFQREVEAVARLIHPNIVMAYDADEAEAGHFLVMEFVNGRDLASAVQQRGLLPVGEAVECVVQAARALEYAHGQGIIHRDIKPANLLRDVNGVVKVADLGLARFSEQFGRPTEEMSPLTQAGAIMGTVDFMPPEQALGLTNIDHRADIYSLGCTLYFLLIGRAPYDGPTMMAVLLQHREAPIPSLSMVREEVPAELDSVFRRMVAKKPEERYASMAEVARALEAVLSVLDPHSKPPSAPAAVQPGAFSLRGTVLAAPDTAQAAGSAAAVNETVDLAPARTSGPRGRTVLLVEPSRAQAVIIRKYLQELGFPEVPTLPSGEQALQTARNSPPQVVISAMHLADMTGMQLAQQMRAEGPLATTGFVLITSQGDSQEANFQSLAGAVVRLVKPFDLKELAQALAVATAGKPRNTLLAAATDPSKLRVLIVDDSAAARRHIRSVLEGLVLSQFVEAADGAQAVAAVSRETFDVIVTDYNMPYMDGRGLAGYLRQNPATASVPIIMVTTETDPVKLEAVGQLGVTVCEKSFQPEVVRKIIDQLVGTS